ncbi:hypothetical protein HMPREF1548_03831 [Clostridium sp. KLE 1755]|nr:hypothetical protein HMPREF1548_03831 [Clostridium sp. KLE 1755]
MYYRGSFTAFLGEELWKLYNEHYLTAKKKAAPDMPLMQISERHPHCIRIIFMKYFM